jgi:hypothetical protein
VPRRLAHSPVATSGNRCRQIKQERHDARGSTFRLRLSASGRTLFPTRRPGVAGGQPSVRSGNRGADGRGVTFAIPVSSHDSIKFAFISGLRAGKGADFGTVLGAYQYRWFDGP